MGLEAEHVRRRDWNDALAEFALSNVKNGLTRGSRSLKDAESPAHERLRHWLFGYQRLRQRCFAAFPFHGSRRSENLFFSIAHLAKEGLVVVDFQVKAPADVKSPSGQDIVLETGKLLVNIESQSNKQAWECTCKSFAANRVCNHVVQFANAICEQLESPSSPLSNRIPENDFSTKPFDYDSFHALQVTYILDRLSTLLPTAEVPEDNELPQVEQTLPSRLAWCFHATRDSLSVSVSFQRQKKRGNGWLKGQRLALSDLLVDDRLLVSEQDRQAAQCLKRQHDSHRYFQANVEVDYPALIVRLVDHPAVFLNERPVTLSLSDLKMTLVEKGDFSSLSVALPFQRSHSTICHIKPNGLVFTDLETQILHVIRCTPHQSRFLQRLSDSPVVFQTKNIDQYLPQLESLGKQVPIQLPKEYAGEPREETIRPVILMRSRTSGELDFGLRIRDAVGRLFRPGHGSPIHYEITDKQRIQWCRNLQEERQRCLDLAAHLGIDDILDEEEFYGILHEFGRGIDLLEKLESLKDEIEVCWDKTTERRPSVVGSVTAQNLKVQLSTKRDWFGVEGRCQLNDESFDLADIIDSLAKANADGNIQGNFIQIGKDQWAHISQRLQQRLRRLADHAHVERGKLKVGVTAVPSIQALLEDDIQVDAPKKWNETVSRLHKAENLNPVVPESLNAELRNYQKEGFAWMRRLAEWGVGGVLADDMGLGKTVQTLAVLLDRKESGPALVIAPTSVGFNWARETEKFTPDLKPHLYRDTDRGELLEKVGPGDLVILSYGLALRDEKLLSKVKWGTMILDEAQAVKNSRSKTARSVSNIEADWKLALTGTPVENHLGELWSIFRVVSPGLLGSWEQFRNKFATAIERDNCPKRQVALSSLLQPFILRRTKSAVLKDLPARTESNLYVDLSKAERAKYETWRMAAIGEIEGLEALTDTPDQRFQILAILTRLRQLACNVGLVDKDWQGESSKLELLMETMQELKSEGHRALVFSQFTEHLSKIRQAFDQAGISYKYLDGSTPAKQRAELVDQFQGGEGDAFLISLKAGGTGLNLTAADYVIHMDPWWNPAVEDQATDRAHRIGQTRPVMVYRIIARGTIEEEILRLHESKRDLVAGILDGTSKAAKLSTEELIGLIRQG